MATAKKPQKPEGGTVSTVPGVEVKATTTVQVRVETKGRLESLKEMFRASDYDSTITRLIDNIPAKLSTEEIVILEMTRSKHRWLISKISHSDQCDCRRLLVESER